MAAYKIMFQSMMPCHSDEAARADKHLHVSFTFDMSDNPRAAQNFMWRYGQVVPDTFSLDRRLFFNPFQIPLMLSRLERHSTARSGLKTT